MKELDASITVTEGGRPKKISKQRAVIKTLVNGAIKGNTRAIANLFKLTRTHHVNLNDDCDAIYILAERMEFVGELFDETSTSPLTSGLSVEQRVRYMEEFLRDGVSYLTGKLRLGRDHPLNLQPRPKIRPSASFADDLVSELREQISIKEGGKKLTITKLEALVKSLLKQAIIGTDTAFSLLLTLSKQYRRNKKDNSVLKIPLDGSPFAQFIGAQPRERREPQRSNRSKRLLGSQDGKESDDK
jgi:hypothetical protein